MVKAELTIEAHKDNKLHITLDLLKREDAQDLEWELANTIQKILLETIEILTKTSGVNLIKQEIIK